MSAKLYLNKKLSNKVISKHIYVILNNLVLTKTSFRNNQRERCQRFEDAQSSLENILKTLVLKVLLFLAQGEFVIHKEFSVKNGFPVGTLRKSNKGRVKKCTFQTDIQELERNNLRNAFFNSNEIREQSMESFKYSVKIESSYFAADIQGRIPILHFGSL